MGYYARKRELKTLKSCQSICSLFASKVMCELLTNWTIILLMKCSKQLRNSSQIAVWIFWSNYCSCPGWKWAPSALKRETVVISAIAFLSASLVKLSGFHYRYHENMVGLCSVDDMWPTELHCLWSFLNLHVPLPSTCYSERVSFCPSHHQTNRLELHQKATCYF